MARRVVWSYDAASDLEALAEYIAKDSPYYAAAFVRDVRDASRSLDRFSERGRMVPEVSDAKVRELFVKAYRLIYAVEPKRVVILGLIHGKRDLSKLWDKRERGK
jgi:toxin ParE1/3/4